MKEPSKRSYSEIMREFRSKQESLSSIKRELEPCEDDKENSSKHRRSPVLLDPRDTKLSAQKANCRDTALSPLQNVKNEVTSPQKQLVPSHTVEPTKAEIFLAIQTKYKSLLNERSLKSDSLKIPTNKSKQTTDRASTALTPFGSTETTEMVDDDHERIKSDENTFQEGTSELRRSGRMKRKPIRFDLEYGGLGSMPNPEALVEPSDNENGKQDSPTSVHELELLLKRASSPLPFCDPFSSIYSFGSIGRGKLLIPPSPPPRGGDVLLSDMFAPEGVFSSVELLSKLDLSSNEEAKPKQSSNVELSETMYEGSKIADMTPLKYCRMLRNIAHGSLESPDRAHSILRGTIQQYHDCIGTIRPDGACFNAVIHGYAQLGYAAAAENVLSLMFQEFINNGNDLAKPNVRVYTNVLHAWRKSKSVDAHARCEKIIEEMRRVSESGIVPECRPDTYAYTVLFHCLADSDCADASKIAERQLKQMKEDSTSGKLDSIAYSTLLNIFTKNPATHERAEEVLWEMVADYKGGNQKAKPHTRNFNTVLAMWAKSNAPDSAPRAQGVVERLIQLREDRILWVQPDEYTYSLLLKSWVSKGRSGIEHAVNCLHWMEERHRHGDKAAKLDIIKYTTCIGALSREGLAYQAEILLKKMERDHRNGNKDARPDVKNFETVISSWSGFYGSSHEINENRAENLLRTMWTLGQQPSFAHIRPGVLAYTRVVEAMARKSHPERSETLLDEMVSLNKIGRLPAGPDLKTYHVVINAWVNSNRTDRHVRAGQLRARMNLHFGTGN